MNTILENIFDLIEEVRKRVNKAGIRVKQKEINDISSRKFEKKKQDRTRKEWLSKI
jgi:hypothetical protein